MEEVKIKQLTLDILLNQTLLELIIFVFVFGYKNNKVRTFFPKSGHFSSNLTIKQKIDMRNAFKNIISTANSKKIVKLKHLKRLNQGAPLSYFR